MLVWVIVKSVVMSCVNDDDHDDADDCVDEDGDVDDIDVDAYYGNDVVAVDDGVGGEDDGAAVDGVDDDDD
eukprot:9221034-Pyramimonas_sp.AAC.1